jgi:hypothetical protein
MLSKMQCDLVSLYIAAAVGVIIFISTISKVSMILSFHTSAYMLHLFIYSNTDETKSLELQILDGMPKLEPFGVTDWHLKVHVTYTSYTTTIVTQCFNALCQ